MKQKINVIDLDNTLLPYDSFRRYIYIFLKIPQTFFHILFLLILRKVGIIKLFYFKKSVIKKARCVKNYNIIMKNFAEKLYNDINSSVFTQIQHYTDKQTKVVLCTASIEDYVRFLSNLLGWEFVCSRFDLRGENFIHVHGNEKIITLEKLYSSQRYDYNFAVSDSDSDLELLKKFRYYTLL